MAITFPTGPSDGATHRLFGVDYVYRSTTDNWVSLASVKPNVLGDLTDVDTTGVASEQVFSYDSDSSEWKPVTPATIVSRGFAGGGTSIALGTNTTGNYVATVAAGTGISVTGSGSETAGVTVTHGDTSTLSGNYGSTDGSTTVNRISVDSNGHVTAVSTAAPGGGGSNPFAGTSTFNGSVSVDTRTTKTTAITIPAGASGCTFLASQSRGPRNTGNGFTLITNHGTIQGITPTVSDDQTGYAMVSIDFTTGIIFTWSGIGAVATSAGQSFVNTYHLGAGAVTSLQLGGTHGDSSRGNTSYAWDGVFF